jgi:hypothetical protein
MVRAVEPGICQAKASGRPQCGSSGLWDIGIVRWRGRDSCAHSGSRRLRIGQMGIYLLAFALSRARGSKLCA